MRKPRDFDSELQALNEKAKLLKERRVHQLGELVIATAADVLPVEHLAGALLAAVETADAATKEGWRKRGAAFFQGSKRNGDRARRDGGGTQASDGGATSGSGADRA